MNLSSLLGQQTRNSDEQCVIVESSFVASRLAQTRDSVPLMRLSKYRPFACYNHRMEQDWISWLSKRWRLISGLIVLEIFLAMLFFTSTQVAAYGLLVVGTILRGRMGDVCDSSGFRRIQSKLQDSPIFCLAGLCNMRPPSSPEPFPAEGTCRSGGPTHTLVRSRRVAVLDRPNSSTGPLPILPIRFDRHWNRRMSRVRKVVHRDACMSNYQGGKPTGREA